MSKLGYTATTVPAGINYRFFGRKGGASTGIFRSLNLRPALEGETTALQQNLQIIAQEMQVEPNHLFFPHQVHGNSLVVIQEENFFQLEGADNYYNNQVPFVDADGAVTNIKGVALGIITADCAPLLMFDAQQQVIAAVHCGWRSAFKDIIANAVTEMQELGAEPSHIHAVIGPCIAQASYEVDTSYYQEFIEQNQDYAQFFQASTVEGKYYFSLRDFCQYKLAAAQVTHIEHVAHDTYAEAEEFYSFRRDGENAGRQASVIVLQ